ncbi:MAG: recombinase family protein [Dehalococcoidia bacterium]|nr:recombinase family protein [Dehalococcoidia bacterium]
MNKVRSITATIYAAIYLRLSRDDQNGNTESMSIQNQRDMLISYCDERGWKIYDIYVDDGFTGTNFDRPDFQRMISDIKAGNINVVLTKDLSRLGRNYILTGQYTDFFFPEHGVRYLAVNDSYDSDKEDNDIAPFRNVLNEMFARDISRKVRSVRVTSAKQGKFMGSKPPYGYMKSSENKHQLIVDAPAAEVVRRLFREYLSGDSARNIAAKLNADGIDTPATYYFKQTGKRATQTNNCQRWGSSTIMQLLRNQVYIGHMVQGKRKVSSFKTKKRVFTGKDDWITVQNTHEPIIENADWEDAQRRLTKAKNFASNHTIKKSNSIDEVNLFSGIIRCADCGAAMVFNHRERKRKAAKSYYRCSRYVNNGSNACTAHSIETQALASVILQEIQNYARTVTQGETELFSKLLALSGENAENEAKMTEKTLHATESRISFIETAGKQLFEEKVNGNVPDAMFKKMMAEYQLEIEQLTEKVSELRKQIQDTRNSKADVQRWMNLVKECSTIKKLDRATAYQLIDCVSVKEQSDGYGVRTQKISVKYNYIGNLCLN